MKIMRKIIQIDEELCDGCGQCVPACDEGAIQVIDGKARVVAEKYCDGLGACLGDCPQGAISIVERMAEDFDPEAVEEYLKNRKDNTAPDGSSQETLACGCPSTQMQTFASDSCGCGCGGDANDAAVPVSALGHWPVQIRLIPAHAPFLQNADLLILADCAAVAYAGLHQNLLKNRIVMMGCPKFDDLPDYEERFTEIFSKNMINSITVVTMEVPCCSGLPVAVEKALSRSGKTVPITGIVLNLKGEPLN
ncbi:MAG: 4Fe-4S ferredoxin [Deltaproteobacteria bacterium]|nr:4Fe-4S ferredoxin [Deltaproteobacteria bacterium]